MSLRLRLGSAVSRVLVGLVLLVVAALARPVDEAWADVCPEPNNQPESACFLPEGSIVQGEIDAAGELDLYVIEVAAPGTRVRAELTNLPADYDLFLATETNDLLGQSEREGLAPEALEITLQAAGRYYLYVRVAPNREFTPAAAYTLSLVYTVKPEPVIAGPVESPPLGEPQPAAPADNQPPAAPGEPPAVAAPSGDPWVGDLRCGYDASGNGTITAGGRLSAIGETTLHCFFAWRNVPASAPITIEVRQDKATMHREAAPAGALEGSRQISANRIGGPNSRTVEKEEWDGRERTVVYEQEAVSYTCEVKVYLNDREVAAIWFEIA